MFAGSAVYVFMIFTFIFCLFLVPSFFHTLSRRYILLLVLSFVSTHANTHTHTNKPTLPIHHPFALFCPSHPRLSALTYLFLSLSFLTLIPPLLFLPLLHSPHSFLSLIYISSFFPYVPYSLYPPLLFHSLLSFTPPSTRFPLTRTTLSLFLFPLTLSFTRLASSFPSSVLSSLTLPPLPPIRSFTRLS